MAKGLTKILRSKKKPKGGLNCTIQANIFITDYKMIDFPVDDLNSMRN